MPPTPKAVANITSNFTIHSEDWGVTTEDIRARHAYALRKWVAADPSGAEIEGKTYVPIPVDYFEKTEGRIRGRYWSFSLASTRHDKLLV